MTHAPDPLAGFLATLSQAAEIPVWLTPRTGPPLVSDQPLPGFCSLVMRSAEGRSRCMDSFRDALREQLASGQPSISYRCHAGLRFVVALVSGTADWDSCIVAGRCPDAPLDVEAVGQLAREVGVDPALLEREALSIEPLSAGRLSAIQSHLDLLMRGGDAVKRYREEATDLRMELATLAQVGVRLGNVLPAGLFLEELLQLAVEMIDAGAGLIALADEKVGVLRTAASKGAPEAVAALRYLALRSPEPRAVMATGEPQMVSAGDVEAYLASLGRPDAGTLDSVFWIPMKSAGEVVGLLAVSCVEPPSARKSMLYFTLLQLLAVQGGVAVASAALQGELLEKERLTTRLLDATIHAQEEERERICLEIHDGVAQTLVAALRHAEAAGALSGEEQCELAEPLERATDLVRASLKEVREILGSLRPSTLDTLGLAATLRQLLSHLETDQGWQTELVANPLRLSKEIETMLFRILQEAITNARKHSGTQRLRVQMYSGQQGVVAEVQDWGRGFVVSELSDREDNRKSVGLLSMRKRAELLGGRCLVTSEPGVGTVVRVELPVLERKQADGSDFNTDR